MAPKGFTGMSSWSKLFPVPTQAALVESKRPGGGPPTRYIQLTEVRGGHHGQDISHKVTEVSHLALPNTHSISGWDGGGRPFHTS